MACAYRRWCKKTSYRPGGENVGLRGYACSGRHISSLTDVSGHMSFLFRNSQLSTLYNAVRSRTEMTIVTTVRYQGNALTDTFNANRVQCLTLLVHTSTNSVNTTASAKFRNKSYKHTNYKNKQKIVNTQTCKRRWLRLSYYWIRSNVKIGTNPLKRHRDDMLAGVNLRVFHGWITRRAKKNFRASVRHPGR